MACDARHRYGRRAHLLNYGPGNDGYDRASATVSQRSARAAKRALESVDANVNDMPLEEWGAGAGTFTCTKRPIIKTDIGKGFVTGCFDEGKRNTKDKVNNSDNK